MIQLIGRDDLPHIQYEVAWSLTNIATGNEEQTFCLIEKGAISRFVMLLSSSYDNLKDQVYYIYVQCAICVVNVGPWEPCRRQRKK